MKERYNLTQDRLKEVIHYDPDSGSMIRKYDGRRFRAGDHVSGKTHRGYLRVMIDGIRYMAHDLAWLYMTGEFPKNIIDHIDCNTSNMKWSNLREATQQENCCNKSIARNNTSGFKGVKWHKRSQKWYGSVTHMGKRHHVGEFNTKEAAANAVMFLREMLYGEFTNHGIA